jgi:hypothetical protein
MNCWLAFWMLLLAVGNVKINSDKQQAVFEHEMQSAQILTVGFSDFYFEFQQIVI